MSPTKMELGNSWKSEKKSCYLNTVLVTHPKVDRLLSDQFHLPIFLIY